MISEEDSSYEVNRPSARKVKRINTKANASLQDSLNPGIVRKDVDVDTNTKKGTEKGPAEQLVEVTANERNQEKEKIRTESDKDTQSNEEKKLE